MICKGKHCFQQYTFRFLIDPKHQNNLIRDHRRAAADIRSCEVNINLQGYICHCICHVYAIVTDLIGFDYMIAVSFQLDI